MGRVLPFIFVSIALVATAVTQAQTDQQKLTAAPLTVTDEINVEILDSPEVP